MVLLWSLLRQILDAEDGTVCIAGWPLSWYDVQKHHIFQPGITTTTCRDGFMCTVIPAFPYANEESLLKDSS